jgi:hypothetical protein
MSLLFRISWSIFQQLTSGKCSSKRFPALLVGGLMLSVAPLSGATAPGGIAQTSIWGWWDCSDYLNVVNTSSGLALSGWEQPSTGNTSIIDSSGAGHPLNSFALKTNQRVVARDSVSKLGGLDLDTDTGNGNNQVGLRASAAPMGKNVPWTIYLVFTRKGKYYDSGSSVSKRQPFLGYGTTNLATIESDASGGAMKLWTGSASEQVIVASPERIVTYALVIRNTPGAGVDVWVNGTKTLTAVPNPMGASISANLNFMGKEGGYGEGLYRGHFHEAAFWTSSLSDTEVNQLTHPTTGWAGRWMLGPRKLVGLLLGGQSNAVFFSEDGAFSRMNRLVAWLLGASGSRNLASRYDPPGRTMAGGNALSQWVNGDGLDPGTWQTWPRNTIGIETNTYITGTLTPDDRADCVGVAWFHTEYDSRDGFDYKPTLKAEWLRWMQLVRESFGKSASELPFFVWSPIPYPTTTNGDGHRSIREIYKELGDPATNLNVVIPHAADMNPRGATGPDANGLYTGGDSYHMDAGDNFIIAARAAFNIAKHLSDKGYADARSFSPDLPSMGPKMIWAHKVNSTTIDITVQHDKGTDLRLGIPASQGRGWRVIDGATSLSVSSCSKIAGNKLRLTLSSALTGPSSGVKVWWVYDNGKTYRNGSIYDNWSTLAKPVGYENIGVVGGNIDFPLQTVVHPLTLSDQSLLAVWKDTQFGTNPPASLAGDDVVNNPVGISNLLAYFLGADPFGATTKDLPAFGQAVVSGSNRMALDFKRNPLADSTCVVEVNDDLNNPSGWTTLTTFSAGAWSPAGFASETAGGSSVLVRVRDSQSMNLANSRFMRLRVVP